MLRLFKTPPKTELEKAYDVLTDILKRILLREDIANSHILKANFNKGDLLKRLNDSKDPLAVLLDNVDNMATIRLELGVGVNDGVDYQLHQLYQAYQAMNGRRVALETLLWVLENDDVESDSALLTQVLKNNKLDEQCLSKALGSLRKMLGSDEDVRLTMLMTRLEQNKNGPQLKLVKI